MTGTSVEQRPPGTLVPVPGTRRQRKRESEALPARWLRAGRRNQAVSVPLAVPPVIWTAAEAMHAAGMMPEAMAAGGSVVGAVAVWLFAPHKWTKDDGTPQRREVWYARASAVALAAWGAPAVFAGPASAPAAGSLLVLAAAWGVPWYRHYRVRGRKDRERFLRDCQAFWDGHAHAWGVPGSRVIDAEETPAQIRLRVQLVGGRQSLQALRGAVHLIESAVPVDAGMVKVAGVKGNASQAIVVITKENPLAEVVEWDQSLAPSSVHETAVEGLSETGSLSRTPMRVSAFVNGATRTGKGNRLLLRAAQLSGCPDDRQVVIDLKQRAARTLLRSGGLEYVITTVPEARAYFAMLRAERAARARDADPTEEQLLASELTPALHTLIDEAYPLTSEMAGDAQCARELGLLAAEGAGLEEYVEVYTQYGALSESVRTEQTRSNLPLRVCYRVESPGHGVYALGEGGGDASKLEEKGEFLMKLGPKARQERLRAPHMPFSLFLEVVAANAARLRRRPLQLWCGAEESVVPGMTWQQWWDRRFLRIDLRFRADSPQYAAAVDEFGEPGERQAGPPPRRDPADATSVAPVAPVTAEAEKTAGGAEVAARIAAETAGPDLALVPGAAARGQEIYEQSLARFFGLLAAAPPAGTRMADLIASSGLPTSTAYKVRDRLAERAAVSLPGRGLIAPVPGRDAAAEYAALRAGDDALGRAAERRLQFVS